MLLGYWEEGAGLKVVKAGMNLTSKVAVVSTSTLKIVFFKVSKSQVSADA